MNSNNLYNNNMNKCMRLVNHRSNQGRLNNIIGPWAKQCTGTLPAQPLTEITM